MLNKIHEAVQNAYGDSPMHLYERLDVQNHTVQGTILREVGTETRATIRGYLAGTFREFRPGQQEVRGGVDTSLDGFIDDCLVEIIPVSTLDFSPSAPPTAAIVSAAAKARWAGVKKAILVTIDRDNQDWAFWVISGEQGFDQAARHAESPTNAIVKPDLEVRPAPEIVAKVNKYLWGLNLVDTGRTKKVFHPSEFSISKCDRALAYGLNGTVPVENVDPKLRRIFDTGHCVHNVLQTALGHAIPEFRPEVRIKNSGLRIAGSCDGVLPGRDDSLDGIEIKSIGRNGFSKLTRAKPEHQKQAVIYGANLDLAGIHYIYACKETGELSTYYVPVDRHMWHSLATKATNIIKTVDQGLLPPQISDTHTCKSCKFSWTCKPELSQNTHDTLRSFR